MRNAIVLFSIFLFSFAVLAQTDCYEEKQNLLTEFIPTSFDKGRSTVGADEVVPIKLKIQDFITSRPDLLITDISIDSISSKAPFFISKSLIDPRSDERNFELAQERAIFAAKALEEIKNSRSEFSSIKMTTNAFLGGPAFNRMDLNTRFVTKMTPGYEEKMRALFEENKDFYINQALVKSPKELMDETKFVNYYQAKFKAFQGFKLSILGHHKNELKCSEDKGSKNKKMLPSKTTKQ
jgi:hypothetical protein